MMTAAGGIPLCLLRNVIRQGRRKKKRSMDHRLSYVGAPINNQYKQLLQRKDIKVFKWSSAILKRLSMNRASKRVKNSNDVCVFGLQDKNEFQMLFLFSFLLLNYVITHNYTHHLASSSNKLIFLSFMAWL